MVTQPKLECKSNIKMIANNSCSEEMMMFGYLLTVDSLSIYKELTHIDNTSLQCQLLKKNVD